MNIVNPVDMKVDEGDVTVDEGDVTVDDVDVTVDDLAPMTGRPRPYTHGHVASGCVYLQKSRCLDVEMVKLC